MLQEKPYFLPASALGLAFLLISPSPDKHPSFSEDTGKRLILQISPPSPAHLRDLFNFSSVTLSTNTGAPCHSPSLLCLERICVDVSQSLLCIQLSHAVTPTPMLLDHVVCNYCPCRPLMPQSPTPLPIQCSLTSNPA